MLEQMSQDNFRARIGGLSLVSFSSLREDLKRLQPSVNVNELIDIAQARIGELTSAEPGFEPVQPIRLVGQGEMRLGGFRKFQVVFGMPAAHGF